MPWMDDLHISQASICSSDEYIDRYDVCDICIYIWYMRIYVYVCVRSVYIVMAQLVCQKDIDNDSAK